MKIVLVDNTEIPVTSVNRSFRPADNVSKESVNLRLLSGIDLESVKDKITQENCQTVIVRRDGLDDIVYSDYELMSFNENVSEYDTDVSITLSK